MAFCALFVARVMGHDHAGGGHWDQMFRKLTLASPVISARGNEGHKHGDQARHQGRKYVLLSVQTETEQSTHSDSKALMEFSFGHCLINDAPSAAAAALGEMLRLAGPCSGSVREKGLRLRIFFF